MPNDCTCFGGGICTGFGGAPFGGAPCGFGWGLGGGLCNPCGFGGLNANQNVNINNNTNNNTNNNANANNMNNTTGSNSNMFGGLMNNFGSMFPGCVPMGGCGIPGFGGGGCCGTTTAFPPMPPLMPNCNCCCDTESCNDPCRRGFCVRNFRIISPDGRECSFPVAMPWWACGPTGGVAPIAGSTVLTDAAVPEIVDIPAAPVAMPAQMEESPRQDNCMTASQLLMQRYMLDQPQRNTYETARYYEPSRYAHAPCQPNAAPPEYMQQPQRVYRDAPEQD
ncbi:MAG: hypothetical protein FWD06_00875 [Oscillospiraceae bacterium]|nr:hypothetical protein [Oscillospiraceae bacterium]